MASTLPKEEKGIAAFLKKVQKFASKEFLWLIAVVFLSFPVTLLLLFLADIITPGISATLEADGIDIIDLALVLYVASALGIYFIRMVVSALKVLATKQP